MTPLSAPRRRTIPSSNRPTVTPSVRIRRAEHLSGGKKVGLHCLTPYGSNKVALTVLNARNPDGSLVIQSPQIAGTGVNYAVPTTMRSE